MLRRLSIALFGGLVIAACGETTDLPAGSGQSALGTYRDGCDEAACRDRPAPAHSCVGGYAASVCTKARGTCGWQVDCVADPPPDYDPLASIGNCPGAPGVCGALPADDPLACVWGFHGEPSCERLNKSPCAWTRRCRPEPCDRTGSCNVLDRSKVGEACGEGGCPKGATCASISVNLGDYVPASCIVGNPCAALTCAAGRTCSILESYPAQVVCGE